MKDDKSTKRVTVSLIAMSLVACFLLLGPAHAQAVGVAFCFLVHGKAGDETTSRTTLEYALFTGESRTEARSAAYAQVNAALLEKYDNLIGRSAHEHGEGVDGPRCDTWAFSSGYWTLIETKFADSLYT